MIEEHTSFFEAKKKGEEEEEKEEKEGDNKGMALSIIIKCKKTDGKGWHCKRLAQNPNSLCSHYLAQFRSYRSRFGDKVAGDLTKNLLLRSVMPERDTITTTITPFLGLGGASAEVLSMKAANKVMMMLLLMKKKMMMMTTTTMIVRGRRRRRGE